MTHPTPNLIDNKSTRKHTDKYLTITINLKTVLESWKMSLFSFEWLTPEGTIRTLDQLSETEREKYQTVLTQYKNGEALERPILGIGIMDSIEIGSRRDVLLTLASQGVEVLNVHIPKSNHNDFTPYL